MGRSLGLILVIASEIQRRALAVARLGAALLVAGKSRVELFFPFYVNRSAIETSSASAHLCHVSMDGTVCPFSTRGDVAVGFAFNAEIVL
jgi:hypothetical protein